MSQEYKKRGSRFRFPEFLLKLLFTRQLAEKTCSHLDQIEAVRPETDVCPQCVELGDTWPALRMCLICGFVGCCDTSKNKHMLAHVHETGHPIIRSIQHGEAWIWCYEDEAFITAKSEQIQRFVPGYPDSEAQRQES